MRSMYKRTQQTEKQNHFDTISSFQNIVESYIPLGYVIVGKENLQDSARAVVRGYSADILAGADSDIAKKVWLMILSDTTGIKVK